MTGPDPVEFGWWLASRAAGVVALLCIAVSVGIGLAMAGRVSRRPALARTLLTVHQQTALVGLVAIAVHGIALLGDRFLSPSIGDIVLPFTSTYEPLWTGLGVTAGWLGALLGLSYWIRHRIGPALWRKLHRATVLVYVLAVAHTLGAGTDASTSWMRVLLVVTGAPIVFLFIMRVLTPATGAVFRRYRVTGLTLESGSVCSFELAPARWTRLPAPEPGQFVIVRADVPGAGPTTRSYSVSGAANGRRLRISVKREPGGVMSEHLHAALDAGSTIELAGPQGRFVLGPHPTRPVILISAGIGATPVLAMLHSLAAEGSEREVWWIHGARNGREHPFRAEARQLVARLPNGTTHIRYSQPDRRDALGRDHHAEGRIDARALLALGVPLDAEYRLCGPPSFVADLQAGLCAAGVDPPRIASESFGGPPPKRPKPPEAPTPPSVAAAPSPGAPSVEFSRSGVTAAWEPRCASLLDLAEANGVTPPFGCRVGTCHGCHARVIDGAVRHDPEPLEPAPSGGALLCCAVPEGNVVLDA
ncbi:MAG TPA: 2Fe-2S iron-sulfur cluster-binding protein [Thermoleophilaceae bacterium]|nr:2Fe-2S iron-sulfur cluster-binding protein [Thermoleophilaceae bacterium]